MCKDPAYLVKTHNFREAAKHRNGRRKRGGGTVIVPLSCIDGGGRVFERGVKHCEERVLWEGREK